MGQKIYRRYRKLTLDEQTAKLGFNELDMIKDGSMLSPKEMEAFERACLVKEDIIVEED